MAIFRCLLQVMYTYSLQSGADANIPNTTGDTPLHKAAFTGRKVPLCMGSYSLKATQDNMLQSQNHPTLNLLIFDLFIY